MLEEVSVEEWGLGINGSGEVEINKYVELGLNPVDEVRSMVGSTVG